MHNERFYTTKNINKIKIAIISDIHFYPGYNIKIFDTILKQMKKNNPTYITIVGDIVDSSEYKEIEKLITFIKDLANIAPVIVVSGNHDEKKGYIHNWFFQKNTILIEELNSIANVHYLNDSTWTDNNITFYGFNLSYHYYEETNEDYETFCEEVKSLDCNIPKDTYNITLFHSPINIYTFLKNNKNHNLNNSDLILSGHMHNGCLPFTISYLINKLFKSSRSLVSADRSLFPKYAQGHVYGDKQGYIYEGIIKLSHSTRIFHKLDFLFPKRVEFLTIENSKN